MKNKIIVILCLLACIAGVVSCNITHNKNVKNEDTITPKNEQTKKENGTVVKTETEPVKQQKVLKSSISSEIQNTKKIQPSKEEKFIINTNLYNNLPDSAIPLSAIGLMSGVSKNIQEKVAKITDNNNIYMIQKQNNKLFIVTDNPENLRHSIEFTEISLDNGHQTKTTLGYNDKMQDSDNDIWEYDKNTHAPIRHTKYNENGDMDFVEVWNYDAENPVKYEMKDAQGRVISMRKETLENGTDLRVEHLVYDKEGNTKVNVSASYDGQDIKRFTYYNADKPNEGGAIYSEYSNGQKTKETVYTSDLKVKNSYTSEYKDGTREEITKWDSENKEVQKYVPNEVSEL